MKPSLVELRPRIVDAVDRGVASVPPVAALFSVSVGCVTGSLRRRAQTGVGGALLYEGGTTAEATEAFVTAGLAGGRRRGDLVLRDNLSSHTHSDVIRNC